MTTANGNGDKAELTRRAAWLQRYQDSLRAERMLRNRIAQTRTRLEATTRALSWTAGRGGGPDSQDKIGAGLASLEKYQACLEAQLGNSEAIRAQVEAAIDTLSVPLQKEMLKARYIDGMPSWKAANKLYVSESWAKKLHRAALEAICLPPETTNEQESQK